MQRRTRRASGAAPKRRHWESEEQKAVVDWASCYRIADYLSPPQLAALRAELGRAPFLADLMPHVPNGGARVGVEPAILTRLGVIPGVSDLLLFLPRRGYCGAFLEMKAPPQIRSTVTPEQKRWQAIMSAMGYYCAVARGFEAARARLLEYLTP